MTETPVPQAAIDAGAAALHEAECADELCWQEGHANYRSQPNEEIAETVLEGASAALLAGEVSAHRAEQDAVHADLSLLLRVLRMGDHARPQSSHEVMLQAISEVSGIRGALDRAVICIEDRDRQLTRIRSLLGAAILIGGERYVRADYVREALEGDSDG